MTDTRSMQFYAGDRVIRNGTKDRCILMVVMGEFFAVDDNYPNSGPIYKTGAVMGMEQFIFDCKWDYDLICEQDGIIAKYSYESFELLKTNQA